VVPSNRPNDATKSISAQLCLFGKFRLAVLRGRSGVDRPIEIPTAKGRALIAYLAVGAGERVSRERLSALLWGESEVRKARQNLRQVLLKVDRTLAANGLSILDIDKRSAGLRFEGLAADIWDFEALVAKGTPDALAKAAGLYAGDFLGPVDFESAEFGEWLSDQRSRYQDLALTTLSALADQQSAKGSNGAAMGTLRRILAIDPCHEPAHRQLMSLFAAAGMADVALAQYRACKRILRRELDVEPDAATEAQHRHIQDSVFKTRTVTTLLESPGDVVTEYHLPPSGLTTPGQGASETPPDAEWARLPEGRDPESHFASSKSLMLRGRTADAVAHARRALWRSLQGGLTDPFWFLAERLIFRMHLYAPRLPALCQELSARAAGHLGRGDWRAALENLTANAMIAGLVGDAKAMRSSLSESENLLARVHSASAAVLWHQVAGFGRVWSGDGGGACEHFGRALSLSAASGDFVRCAMLRGFQGRARLLNGPVLEAGRDLTAAIDMVEQLGHIPYAPLFHAWMAEYCFGEGLIELGESHADRAQMLERERPQAWCHPAILRAVALVFAKSDRPDLKRAARCLDQSRALQKSLGIAPRAHNRLVMPEFSDATSPRH
jgi:DNA-binding SARP family transcriptional activator